MGLTITPPTTLIQDEGVTQGSITTLNFVGTSATATVSGSTATITDTAMSIGVAILMQQQNYNQ